MRIFLLMSAVFCCCAVPVPAAHAEEQLFTGILEVVTTSGKACAGQKGKHQISLVINRDDSDAVVGYIGGDTVTVGQVRGTYPGSLSLRYPYTDPERAEGHSLQFEINGAVLTGELKDRHLDAAVDDCNFDLARIRLQLSDDDEATHTIYRHLSRRFEAQMYRSTALSISRTGANADAVHVYELALGLADSIYAPDSPHLVLYLTGLANSYIKTGRYQNFIDLYSTRIDFIRDEAVRLIFNRHQVRSLVQVGRAAMGREEYPAALENFRKALLIDYKNKDTISATMSALVRSGQHDAAIAFLEETEQKLDNEPDRQDVREAIALVEYQKARKELKAGRAAEAERSLRRAIKLDPGTAHYVAVLARWMHRAGKYSEAQTVLKRGLESFKDGPQRQELTEAREKLQLTEMILARIRRAGG